ncbi:hypothetical protein RDI58_021465 [Solanum bulbocastanum]|uniref:Uncharacterized protein n=1 Tax=Solanum bulbocastanum TaxID=147425 RepID=A0AAN8T635_SOLBU
MYCVVTKKTITASESSNQRTDASIWCYIATLLYLNHNCYNISDLFFSWFFVLLFRISGCISMANQQQNHATMCWKRENNTDVMISFTDQMDLGVIVLPLHLDGFAAVEMSNNSMSEINCLL